MFPPFPTSEPPARMGGARRSRAASAASGAGQPEPRADRRPRGATWLERLRHAVDLAVAFATLRDDPEHVSAHEPVDRVHPHRTPLRPPTRPRRPGAAERRSDHCVATLEGPRPRPRRERLRELG
jgi:hypothetical protein